MLSLLKPWYVHRPRQILLRAVRQFRRPSGSHARVCLPWGVDLAFDPTETIGWALWSTGLYDIAVSELLYRLTAAGAVAVDAGANIGYMTSILAVRAGANGVVYSFEPHPTIADRLRENTARMSRLPNVAQIHVRQLALSDETGEARLAWREEFASNQGTGFLTHEPAVGISVRTCQLDDAISEGHIDVMKLDVEGHEPAVLRGARRFIAEKRVRHVVFEAHDGPNCEAGRLLQAAGYTLFQVGWQLHRLILVHESHSPVHRSFEAPSCLATVDPDAALAACRPSGWRLYSRRLAA